MHDLLLLKTCFENIYIPLPCEHTLDGCCSCLFTEMLEEDHRVLRGKTNQRSNADISGANPFHQPSGARQQLKHWPHPDGPEPGTDDNMRWLPPEDRKPGQHSLVQGPGL